MYKARQCPNCQKFGAWPETDRVCPACGRVAVDEFDRDWRRLRLYLAFDQYLFDHGLLTDKEGK